MQYRQLLKLLENSSDSSYRDFHKKLLKNDNIRVIGVRVPVLRKIAKSLVGEIQNILTFPDEYYEVTFIKLTAVSLLDYDKFITYIDVCVSLIDNWATCDCFKPKCIAKNKEDFLPYIDKYLSFDGEFYQRFALITLLNYYIEEKYLALIFTSIERADRQKYYVSMASAWLVAEILVKFYDLGVEFLKKGTLDIKTHNKAIQKAIESYRLSSEQKNLLKEIKR